MAAISILPTTTTPSASPLPKSNLFGPNPTRPIRNRVGFTPCKAAATSYSTTAEPQTSTSQFVSAAARASTAGTLYEVLGVTATASAYEIKRAYRNLARVCHPDVVDDGEKDRSATEFIRIHEAYLTLSDAGKRASYDRDLLFRSLRGSGGAGGLAGVGGVSGSRSRFSGYTTRRNWETDQCW